MSFPFYQVNFSHRQLHFSKMFLQIYTTRRSLNVHLLTGIINFSLLVPRQYRRYLPNFTHILTAILLRCYARLGRCHCDATVLLACPQGPCGALAVILGRPVSVATSLRLFWACSKLGSDLGHLGDLTAICSAATALYENSQWPSGDLADFADRSEVAVLCDWGITHNLQATINFKKKGIKKRTKSEGTH